jgi:polyphosphate kinase 2
VPKLKRKEYDKELRKLQTELCLLQDWVKATGERIIVVFEGRDAAGKGGTIRAMTERVSPRTFRLVALPAPSDREKSQMYVQRYLAHFPAAGEIVIFDRSWYNRAGVEHVMGFCTKEQHQHFLDICPEFERHVVNNGIRLIKYWLEVSNKEQRRRFEARIDDPMRQWKLSAMDLPSRLARALVRLFTSTRHDAGGHGHRICAMVHRALRRQAARTPQCADAFSQPDPLQGAEAREGKVALTRQETCLRR